MDGKIYEFGKYLLDIDEQRLQKNGEDVPLSPKVFEVLTVLIKNHNKLVRYDKLMEEVWQDTFVEDTNLRFYIHSLRKAFEEDFIETVPKNGYRFNAEVKTFSKEEFIKKHTGNYNPDEIINPEETLSPSKKSKPFFAKPAGIMAVACLIILVGLLGIYFWQNRESENRVSAQKITILPFSIIGEDSAENKDLQKGLIDSLFYNLSKIKSLKITPTAEVQKISDRKLDSVSIGKKLSSNFVLEGSYRYEGDQLVRVNSRVLNVKNGNVLLNESITVKAESRIKTEKIISLRIARKIYDKLAEIADEKFINRQNLKEEARNNYLKGQKMMRNFDFNRKEEGINTFKKITEIEPNWAKGYAKVAEASVLLNGGFPEWSEVKSFADKALQIDEKIPEAHLALGWFYQSKFDWENAEKSFKRAIEINPEYSDAYVEHSLLLDTQRRFSEAEKQFLKAIELKPFDPFYISSLCHHYYYDKKPDLAVKYCTESMDIDPNFSLAEKYLFWIYTYTKDFENAYRITYAGYTENEIAQDPFYTYLKNGEMTKYWQKRIDDGLNAKGKNKSLSTMATFYANLYDKENTLKYVEELSAKEPFYLMNINPDPLFDFVRNDPRFIEVLKKLNLSS